MNVWAGDVWAGVWMVRSKFCARGLVGRAQAEGRARSSQRLSPAGHGQRPESKPACQCMGDRVREASQTTVRSLGLFSVPRKATSVFLFWKGLLGYHEKIHFWKQGEVPGRDHCRHPPWVVWSGGGSVRARDNGQTFNIFWRQNSQDVVIDKIREHFQKGDNDHW